MWHVTLRVTTELNEECLKHLLWNHLVQDESDVEEAAERLTKMTVAEVRTAVREELQWHGERSVDCGPNVDYPNEYIEGRARARVTLAFYSRRS